MSNENQFAQLIPFVSPEWATGVAPDDPNYTGYFCHTDAYGKFRECNYYDGKLHGAAYSYLSGSGDPLEYDAHFWKGQKVGCMDYHLRRVGDFLTFGDAYKHNGKALRKEHATTRAGEYFNASKSMTFNVKYNAPAAAAKGFQPVN